MRKINLLGAALLACASGAAGQTSEVSLQPGVRDNKLITLDADFAGGWHAGAEHSVYYTSWKYQYWRLKAGYRRDFGPVGADLSAYYGKTWTNLYYNAGVRLDARVNIANRLSVGAAANPNYDSAEKWEMCFNAGAGVRFFRELWATAEYSTIPIYRQSEKRVMVGVMCKSGPLWVHPRVGFPCEGFVKRASIYVSMGYVFNL